MAGTFSKALGGLGGFAAGAPEVIEALVHGARSLLYSTAPPPAQAAVALAGLELVDAEPWRREHLCALSALLRRRLAEAGLTSVGRAGPIVPVLTGSAQASLQLAEGLWERGIFAPAVRPPTVPEGASRIRLTVTAAHQESDIEQAAQALADAAREAGL